MCAVHTNRAKLAGSRRLDKLSLRVNAVMYPLWPLCILNIVCTHQSPLATSCLLLSRRTYWSVATCVDVVK